MKRKNLFFTAARLVLAVLTLAITVFSFAGCLGSGGTGGTGGTGGVLCEHKNIKFFPYTDPTCDEYGNKDVYACMDCNRYFVDEAGKIPTSDELIILFPLGGEHEYADGACTKCGKCQHLNSENCVCKDCNGPAHNAQYVPSKPITCEEDGNIAYYLCADCGIASTDKYFKSVYDISFFINTKNEHVFGDDGICKTCGKFDENEVKCPHTSSTSDCVCLLCKELTHPLLNFVSGTQPTCTQPGYVDYYQCPLCKRVFPESEPINEITDINDIQIPAIGGEHNYVDGACTKCQHREGTPDVTPAYPFLGNPNLCPHPSMRREEPVSPSCFSHGTIEYYYCSDCFGKFLDAEGKNYVDYFSSDIIMIPKLEHREVGGICELCGTINPTENSDKNPSGGDSSNPSTSPATPFESACSLLDQMHDFSYLPTRDDYFLISVLVVDDEVFTITWTIANESVNITYDAESETYIVDVPEEISEQCYYSIVATISDGKGQSEEHLYIRILMPSEE